MNNNKQNTWKVKQSTNTFREVLIEKLNTNHLCAAFHLQIKNYDNLVKEHNYLVKRQKTIEKQMENTALSGLNMQEELIKRNVNFQFKGLVENETYELFLSNFIENNENQKNNIKFEKPNILSQPILQINE